MHPTDISTISFSPKPVIGDKVAMLRYRVSEQCETDDRIVSDEQFNKHLRHLVDAGKFEAVGNILNLGFSEIVKAQDLIKP